MGDGDKGREMNVSVEKAMSPWMPVEKGWV